MLEKRFSERGVANSALFSRKMFSEYIRSYSGDRAPISTFLESVMFVISFQDLRRDAATEGSFRHILRGKPADLVLSRQGCGKFQ